MHYKKLGITNTNIPVIGQGSMGLGGRFTRDDSDDKHAVAVLKKGIEYGMTFIDTAEAYGKGHSEELIGLAVQGQREKVTIASKVSPEHLSCREVVKAAEGSLRRLNTDYLDLYQIHWPNPKIPISETMDALEHLIDTGKIRNIGVSNFSLPELEEAIRRRHAIASVQVEYSLFDRSIEYDLLPFCALRNMTVIAYTPLCSGKVTFDQSKLKVLDELAAKYQKDSSQIALRWLTSSNNVVAIPMSRNVTHLASNAAATDFELSADDYALISRTFAPNILNIPVNDIKTDKRGLEGFTPTAEELAGAIRQGIPIKPIRVVKIDDPNYAYELVEGKLRYWAWVLAHEVPPAIHALLR